MEKFVIITECRDVVSGKEDTYLSDDRLKAYDTREEAFDVALASAEEEAKELNEGGINAPYEVPKNEAYLDKFQVTVNCYGGDDRGGWVTRRSIIPVTI